jgi:hypothetical protein
MILSENEPSLLTKHMENTNTNLGETRSTGYCKLGTPPKSLGRTQITQKAYKNRASEHYKDNSEVLQQIKQVEQLSKSAKLL